MNAVVDRNKRSRVRLFFVGCVLAAACGKVPPPPAHEDGGVPPIPDARMPVDAGVDAPSAEAHPGSARTPSGGGRVTGGTMVIDVEVGHGVSQGQAQGNGTAVQGGPL